MLVKQIGSRMNSRLAAAAVAAGAVLGLSATAHATVISNSVSVGPGQTVSLDTSCAGNGNVVSGGAVTTTPLLRVFASYPLTDFVTWRVSATNTTSGSLTLFTNALCHSGFVSYDMRALNVTAPGGTIGDVSAVCSGSRQAMGGGFFTTNASVPIIGSRIQGNAWRVRAYNVNSGAANITAFVTCSGSLPTRADTSPPDTTTVAPGGTSFPTKYCSSGWLASGGFWSTVDTNWTIVTGSTPNEDGSGTPLWKWNLRNLDSVSHTYERTISCF